MSIEFVAGNRNDSSRSRKISVWIADMLAYPVKLTKDSNGTLLVTCRDLPEVTSFGMDVQDALRRVRDAIEEAIAARIAAREPIPEPSAGRHRVALPAQTAAKVLLYRRMLDKHVSKAELARRLKWHRPQVDRLLDLGHATRLDAIEAALDLLGARMTVGLEPADTLDRPRRRAS